MIAGFGGIFTFLGILFVSVLILFGFCLVLGSSWYFVVWDLFLALRFAEILTGFLGGFGFGRFVCL